MSEVLPEKSNNLDLFIFCHKKYLCNLRHCVYSIKKNVNDNITSYNIITNDKSIKVFKNFKIYYDDELWNIIDPKNQYDILYHNNWIRQQIIKLYTHKLCNNNMLIVDADLIFLNKIKFVEDGKFNFYLSYEYDDRYFQLIETMLNLNKLLPKFNSFISDFTIFNAYYLDKLHCDIYKKNNKTLLDILKDKHNSKNFLLSEYELYGTYLYNKYPEVVKKCILPINYKSHLELPKNFYRKSIKVFYKKLKEKAETNYFQCITYQQ